MSYVHGKYDQNCNLLQKLISVKIIAIPQLIFTFRSAHRCDYFNVENKMSDPIFFFHLLWPKDLFTSQAKCVSLNGIDIESENETIMMQHHQQLF